MRIVASCIIALLLVTSAISAIGHGPTFARWGAEGVQTMNAVGAICLVSALVALIPLALVSIRWPHFIGQAALGCTVLRLMLTMAAGAVYQSIAKPQMGSFVFWAVVFYCLLLVVETAFGVFLVNRYYRPASANREATA